MITAPINLPQLPYSITYNTNSKRIKFRMEGYISSELRIKEIHFAHGQIRFKMRTDNSYTSLSRATSTEIDSIEDAIKYVNEYLCQTAFQLNALRGKGFVGYIRIPDLEGCSITGSGPGYINLYNEDGKQYYRYSIESDTYFIGKDNEIMQFDLKHIPYQIVQLVKKIKEKRNGKR